ncbi:MAG: hypothetical protein KDC26_08590 [Armatimonadetes bacterium]|nr:hypothetical protein [Armatimonadota bacterium]
MNHLRWIGLAAMIAVTPFAFAQDSSEVQLLRKSVASWSKVTFAGVREVQYNDPRNGKQTFTEHVLRKDGKTRIEYPSDSQFSGQIVYEINGKRQVYLKSENSLRETRFRSLDSQFESFTKNSDRYLLRASGEDSVAGRRCNVLKIYTKDSKLREKLWLDKGESIVLRREFFNEKNEAIAGFAYKRIKFDARISDRLFSLPSGAKVATPADDLVKFAREQGMKPYTLGSDSGLRLMLARKSNFDDRKVLRQFFSNDKLRISLLQVAGTNYRESRDSNSKVNIYRWEMDGNTFLLIGEVPLDTLKSLASKVKP